ncbi:MAG: hypothetical protein II857_13095 [Selenomonadaceae bacterium]|nr:hypothetical protein [Selenomonadaceae bacterium]
MDKKKIPDNKIADAELISDKELDSVAGGFGLGAVFFLISAVKSLTDGNNASKKDEPHFSREEDYDRTLHDYGQTGTG